MKTESPMKRATRHFATSPSQPFTSSLRLPFSITTRKKVSGIVTGTSSGAHICSTKAAQQPRPRRSNPKSPNINLPGDVTSSSSR